jgi:ATP-dependent DNA ligase
MNCRKQMGRRTGEDMKRCRWLKPQLVAAIEFLEWTLDNHLRHPKFVAMREDRHAQYRAVLIPAPSRAATTLAAALFPSYLEFSQFVNELDTLQS